MQGRAVIVGVIDVRALMAREGRVTFYRNSTSSL